MANSDLNIGVQVNGYSDLVRTINYVGGDFKKQVKDELRQVGEETRQDAAATALRKRWSTKTATGYRVVVRVRGIAVEQSRRRTTGKQRKFGGVQMREALVPARDRNVDEARARIEKALQAIITRRTL